MLRVTQQIAGMQREADIWDHTAREIGNDIQKGELPRCFEQFLVIDLSKSFWGLYSLPNFGQIDKLWQTDIPMFL